VQLAFTSSTEIGKLIMKQAAEHIVPGETFCDYAAFLQPCCTSSTAGTVPALPCAWGGDRDFYCTDVHNLFRCCSCSYFGAGRHSPFMTCPEMQTLMLRWKLLTGYAFETIQRETLQLKDQAVLPRLVPSAFLVTKVKLPWA